MNKVRIDDEYSCVFMPEAKFIRDNGIRFAYVKKVNGLTIYKLKKTKELFEVLAKFYS